MAKETVIHWLRKVGRSRKTPARATSTCDGTIEHERLKTEQHQHGLALSIAPLVVLLLGAKDFDAIDSLCQQLSSTAVICMTSVSAFLRVCLIAVSRFRVQQLVAAKSEGQDEKTLYFISLDVQRWSEFLALGGYFALAIFLIVAVWT